MRRCLSFLVLATLAACSTDTSNDSAATTNHLSGATSIWSKRGSATAADSAEDNHVDISGLVTTAIGEAGMPPSSATAGYRTPTARTRT